VKFLFLKGEDAPERWLAPLPKTVTDAHIPAVYSTVMTFLGGGRACIGFKFSELEIIKWCERSTLDPAFLTLSLLKR